jgi:hypothetical protein
VSNPLRDSPQRTHVNNHFPEQMALHNLLLQIDPQPEHSSICSSSSYPLPCYLSHKYSPQCTQAPASTSVIISQMPPLPAELHSWWLTTGHDALLTLFERRNDLCSANEVGFAQALQRRLRSFDNDDAIQSSLRREWTAFRTDQEHGGSSVACPNPRKRLKEIIDCIFRSPQSGGINPAAALEGLGQLDEVEARRLCLLSATHTAMESGVTDERYVQALDNLHLASSKHFRQFHMGLRSTVS